MGNKGTSVRSVTPVVQQNTRYSNPSDVPCEKWAEFKYFNSNLSIACASSNQVACHGLPKPIWDIYSVMSQKFYSENATYRTLSNLKTVSSFILSYEESPEDFTEEKLIKSGYTLLGSIVKYWLRNLTEPLCTAELYPYFIECEIEIRDIRVLIRRLPPCNFNFFKVWAHHVRYLSERPGCNMTIHNYSLIFAHHFFRDPNETYEDDDTERLARNIKYQMRFTNILKEIVEEQEKMFLDERDQYQKLKDPSFDCHFSFY